MKKIKFIISSPQTRSIGIGKSRLFRWIFQSNGSICGVLIIAIGFIFLASISVSLAVEVSLPEVSVGQGEKINIPVNVEEVKGISSIALTLEFDPEIISITSVMKTKLTSGFLKAYNVKPPGVLLVSLASARGSSGSGAIVNVRVQVKDNVAAGKVSPLTLAQAKLNEGAISVTIKNGSLTVIPTFPVQLNEGLNMVSLPLEPIVPYTAKTFAEKLGSTIVIKLDKMRFIGYTLANEDDGFPIEGGKGYIINVPEAGTVTFSGNAWGSSREVNAAPASRRTNWAFVLTGRCPANVDTSSATIQLQNLRTGTIATGWNDKTGRYTVVSVDLSRKSVIEPGDTLQITINTPEGEIGQTHHKVTPNEVNQAFAKFHIRKGDLLPPQNLLLQNYPNPFNPETWIPYQLKSPADVTIYIYDVTGRLVRTLQIGEQPAGFYLSRSQSAYWDGKNNTGEKMANGVYLYRLTAGNFSAVRKMMLLK